MKQMVQIESGSSFWGGSSGRWAGERFLAAIKAGRTLSTDDLRVLDTLRKDEWKHFDEQVVEEATIRLIGVADLIRLGLTRTVPDGLAKTVYEYERMTDMGPASVSMDGAARSDNDTQEFTLDGLPLPIIHKDWNVHLRKLLASRLRGETLESVQARVAGRVCAETAEQMLFVGGKTFQGRVIYGYTTHPNRNTTGFGTNGNWVQAAKTGENILDDVNTLVGLAEADRMYGPYMLYIPRNYNTVLNKDFKTNSDKSIRQRLLEVNGIIGINTADQLTSNNVLLVQMTEDVVVEVEGLPLQNIQWDIMGGMIINFKTITIQIPLIRSDASGRSGVQHMS